ncbi:ribonucleoside-diphosphate reductase subunit alpha [Stackebrandtia nassauensis]|uniref:Ribonucleoside-diphosphate reductase n=1 Tax=Stackebrandtia nassauensis (strain DSM 44728 / CIP 108903 / NRRL B-16338 / NBRC 102104 / LLR-40K-21) TaxID=446470 RepID=D3PWX3_STANL|nr:ribonucleoside-diphosphate reductase subunit alpha [Stackebrandtia nassauensis]ADD45197.1 ribonucleoside-diphosphate reductase, alpha subunit [Stackebrandtia nassauensis DSM 44728]
MSTSTIAPRTAAIDHVVQVVRRLASGLADVEAETVSGPVVAGNWPGATEAELRLRAVEVAASLVATEPGYSRLAARLLSEHIGDEVRLSDVGCFSEAMSAGYRAGLISDGLWEFVSSNAPKLDALVDDGADDRFEYFGIRTVYDRYLLRHPETRLVLETPQHFFMRVACGLSETVSDVTELYGLLSTLSYLPSSPTLFNAGTRRSQLSSCFLLDSPRDELESIYDRYSQAARLSKYAGGIGMAWSRIRSRGSLIRGTNGHSNGIVPWLRTLDSSVAAVNQGGRRKGAACVYLATWHADIEEFLELRDNTGSEDRRTHNLNLANWIPDEFMRRVESDGDWSLFDPKDVPELVDLWGEEFEKAYRDAEAAGKAARVVSARDLYGRMMRTLAQTGNGWMTFADISNRTCNQTAVPGNVVHLSNLCTEILEVTSDAETAVCNLGSVNLAAHCVDGGFDFERLARSVRTAVTFLDRSIDLTYYPTAEAEKANRRWRPIGLGLMGMADVFFKLRMPFDSAEARELSNRISETIALAAYETSADLAARLGAHPSYDDTRAARGVLHVDHFADAAVTDPDAWQRVRELVAANGLRNSLMIAIAPTATIAAIAGCSECTEPVVSNVFKRETLSGEFIQVNKYLIADLKQRGLWNEKLREAVVRAEGSIADIAAIPQELRQLYRTAWELPQRALIDLAAGRTPFIDQSQSLNLFMAAPTIGKLSSMYAYAWRSGLKTTYYLRSRPATRINQTTVASAPEVDAEAEAIACSLENPETCEACQ